MGGPHHLGLLVGYALGAVGAVAIARCRPRAWPTAPRAAFAHPWREFGCACLALIALIGLGSLWSAGIRLPESTQAGQIANQVLIFSPMALLLISRRQPPASAWLPMDRLWERLAAGAALAVVALAAYAITTRGVGRIGDVFAQTYAPSRLHNAVQVLLEDFTIGLLLARLCAAVRRRWIAVVVIAVLFAAAHIPAMLSEGAHPADIATLALDAGLAALVLGAVARTQDVWWLWPLHATLDLSQFVTA